MTRRTPRTTRTDKGLPQMRNTIRNLINDEQGGEVLEYVLIAGLIIVGCIAAVTAFGGKVLARWNSLNSGAL